MPAQVLLTMTLMFQYIFCSFFSHLDSFMLSSSAAEDISFVKIRYCSLFLDI